MLDNDAICVSFILLPLGKWKHRDHDVVINESADRDFFLADAWRPFALGI
jgi:hypothetical protein